MARVTLLLAVASKATTNLNRLARTGTPPSARLISTLSPRRTLAAWIALASLLLANPTAHAYDAHSRDTSNITLTTIDGESRHTH